MHDAGKRQIAFINAAHTLNHYGLLILATAVLGIVQQAPEAFGRDYGPILALGPAMFVLYGLGALPMGWLAERVGRKALMSAFFLGVGCSMLLAGMATSPLLLGVALALVGAFSAIYHPIGTAMLVEAAGTRVGRAVGINGVFGNLGVALAPVVTALLAARLGWHVAFIVPGVIALVLGTLLPAGAGLRHRQGGRAAKALPGDPAGHRPPRRRGAADHRRGLRPDLQRLHPAAAEADGGTPRVLPDLLPVVGLLAFLGDALRRADPVHRGSMIDRRTLKSIFLPLALVLVPADGAARLSPMAGWCCRSRR